MFLCRYALFRIIVVTTVIVIVIYLATQKKIAAISKHCRYHDCTNSTDSSELTTILTGEIKKITDMEKAHKG